MFQKTTPAQINGFNVFPHFQRRLNKLRNWECNALFGCLLRFWPRSPVFPPFVLIDCFLPLPAKEGHRPIDYSIATTSVEYQTPDKTQKKLLDFKEWMNKSNKTLFEIFLLFLYYATDFATVPATGRRTRSSRTDRVGGFGSVEQADSSSVRMAESHYKGWCFAVYPTNAIFSNQPSFKWYWWRTRREILSSMDIPNNPIGARFPPIYCQGPETPW